jgi:PAS domain S-box-containing protein
MRADRKFGVWLVVAALLVGIGAALTLFSYSRINNSTVARKHTFQTLSSAAELLSSIKDAETGQRGYLLTGDQTFLKPYLSVRDGLRGELEALRVESDSGPGQQHLNTLTGLLDAKLARMAVAIELRRNHDAAGLAAAIANGEGNRLMDQIRSEMASFMQLEEAALEQRDTELRLNMRNLLTIIVIASLLALLLALLLVYLIYRTSQQQLDHLLHLEAQNLLAIQETTNTQLRHSNASLRSSEEKLAVTLNSIGDAVIATDAGALVTLMNPVAEHLTGWTQAQASGHPVAEVFRIVNKETHQAATIPVFAALAHGTIQGLANHTVLIARDGQEFDIADSCAPIRAHDAEVVGAVLVFRNVSKEYAVQQALRDTASQLQNILNNVVDGIMTIQAGTGIIETANLATEHMFGYSAAEMHGQNFSLLIPELDQDQRKGSLEYYSASDEARASGLAREVLGRRKDGGSFPLEIAVSEMWLGGKRFFAGILRDISARRQAEEALMKADALQNAIFNSDNFSSIATDAKGVIQIFNVGAERMLGYAAVDVVNKITPADISDSQELVARAKTLSLELGTPIAPGFEALVFKASRGIEDIYELTYIRKDGSRLLAVVSVTALRDPHGAIIGYLLIGTDNTARKQTETDRTALDLALAFKNVELERAKSAAEKANMAKSEFLSSMSHELRSPLNAILGFAQLMESSNPPPTEPQKSNINQILQAGWYLLDLINEILDLALIESGKLSMSMEPISLAEILYDCRAMIEPLAKKGGIRLRFPQLDHPYFIAADRTRLKQVLINLLSNAIKYNRTGGSVEVSCNTTPGAHMHIDVRDSGEGLSPEKLAQLFQPFNRLGQETGAEEGTGIGLVVSKRLVEMMGGEIGVQSIAGTGSVFWIELKLTAAPQLVLDDGLAPELLGAQAQPGTALRTLLYVEDNRANLQLVEQLIERRPDMRMLSAGDGIRGITLARIHQPDVILMDINLPGISGIQALKILREDPVTAHIPVLALSANAMPRDVEKGLEAGFFRYLTKPIRVAEFMQALDQGLQLAASAAEYANKEP